ncbi:MAG TPA: gamma-glutamylcyclotransferase, partial [Sphingobium sp.]
MEFAGNRELFLSVSGALLFVYGSLRPGYGGEHAEWLARVARHVGRATVRGALYRIDYYP